MKKKPNVPPRSSSPLSVFVLFGRWIIASLFYYIYHSPAAQLVCFSSFLISSSKRRSPKVILSFFTFFESRFPRQIRFNISTFKTDKLVNGVLISATKDQIVTVPRYHIYPRHLSRPNDVTNSQSSKFDSKQTGTSTTTQPSNVYSNLSPNISRQYVYQQIIHGAKPRA